MRNQSNQGVGVAIVQNLEDPEGMGRVQVSYPWLEDQQELPWAPIARPLAGGERGFWFMPEVEDEVLVAWELGSFDHPIVVGFLHNGVDRPPSSDIDHQVRRIRTVTGHTVDFDDTAGQRKVTITTSGGHALEMVDEPTGKVRLKTNGGHELMLDDAPPGAAHLSTSGGQKISLSDAVQSVEVVTSSGDKVSMMPGVLTIQSNGIVNVDCKMCTLQAKAMLSVNSPLAVFSGIVKAEGIISSAYVPAPGNTLGL